MHQQDPEFFTLLVKNSKGEVVGKEIPLFLDNKRFLTDLICNAKTDQPMVSVQVYCPMSGTIQAHTRLLDTTQEKAVSDYVDTVLKDVIKRAEEHYPLVCNVADDLEILYRQKERTKSKFFAYINVHGRPASSEADHS